MVDKVDRYHPSLILSTERGAKTTLDHPVLFGIRLYNGIAVSLKKKRLMNTGPF